MKDHWWLQLNSWDGEQVLKLISLLGKKWFTSFTSLHREFLCREMSWTRGQSLSHQRAPRGGSGDTSVGYLTHQRFIRVVPFPEQLLCPSGVPYLHAF